MAGWWSPVFVYRVYHLASYENYESISFQIGNKQYVAVPNYRNNNNRYDTDSVIYKYEGNEFVRYQSIRTDGANGERFFEIESEHFLVIAQHYGQTDKHAVSSTIYKWDGIKFKKYQQLKTRSVSTACHFTIDSKHYLAFGKGTTGDNSKSQIYVWNGTQFQFYQHLTSHRTVNIQSFQENGSHYLFLSSFQDRSDDSYNTNSFLFKWSGAQFELHQSIPTRGCRYTSVWKISSFVFVSIPNYFQDSRGYKTNSEIYIWRDNQLHKFLSISTNGGISILPFNVCGKLLIAVANRGDDKTIIYAMLSTRWMQEHEQLSTPSVHHLNSYIYNNHTYLVVSTTSKSLPTLVLEWSC